MKTNFIRVPKNSVVLVDFPSEYNLVQIKTMMDRLKEYGTKRGIDCVWLPAVNFTVVKGIK